MALERAQPYFAPGALLGSYVGTTTLISSEGARFYQIEST